MRPLLQSLPLELTASKVTGKAALRLTCHATRLPQHQAAELHQDGEVLGQPGGLSLHHADTDLPWCWRGRSGSPGSLHGAANPLLR